MQTIRPKRRHYLAALVITLCGAIILATPLVFEFQSSELKLSGVTVYAAPRDVYEATDPVQLTNLPGFTLERGTIMLVDSPGDRSGAASRPPEAATQLVIEGAVIAPSSESDLRRDGPGFDDAVIAPLVLALVNTNLETLTLRRSTLRIRLPDGRDEILSDVNGEFIFKRRASLAAKGTGRLRGHVVAFDVSAQFPADKRPGSVPLKLKLKSPLLEATFDGKLDEGVQFQGHADVSTANLRQVARWLGAGWPLGPGLRNVRMRGEIDWQAAALAFDKAVFQMDGNEASGALAITLGDPRPTITGTLALKSLDITSYVLSGAAPSPSPLLPWAGSADSGSTMPLSRYFDADVRVSSARLVVAGWDAGRFAATLSLKDGRCLADVAELAMEDGRGSGQLIADFTGTEPRLALTGKLEDVDAAHASKALIGHAALEGQSTITADMTAVGGTVPDLARSLGGKIAVSMQDGGRIGIDLRRLLGAAQINDIDGWRIATRGHTIFDRLDVKLAVRDGILRSETMEAVAGDSVISGSGTVNLPANHVDLRLLVGAAPSVAGNPAPNTRRDVLVLRGPWAAPQVGIEKDQRGPADPG